MVHAQDVSLHVEAESRPEGELGGASDAGQHEHMTAGWAWDTSRPDARVCTQVRGQARRWSWHDLVRLAHPSQIGAVRAAIERGHQEIIIGRSDVRRVGHQCLCLRQRSGASKEAAVVHLRTRQAAIELQTHQTAAQCDAPMTHMPCSMAICRSDRSCQQLACLQTGCLP